MTRPGKAARQKRRRDLELRHRQLKKVIAARRAARRACYDFNTWMINRVFVHSHDSLRALEKTIHVDFLRQGFEMYKAAAECNPISVDTCHAELDTIRYESHLIAKKIERCYDKLHDLVSSGLGALARTLRKAEKKDEALYSAFNHSLGHRTGDQRSGAAASAATNDDEQAP